jgi:hypothetical protein
MPSLDPYLIFTRKLSELEVPYMVSGSIAAVYYGEPRITNDVDIIVYLKRNDVSRVIRAFPGEQFYCPPHEVIELELAREQRGHFNLIHHETGFKADVYVTGQDPLHVWGLAHVRTADLEGEKVIFAPPEYVMVRKLQFFREGQSPKHLRDISRMLVGLGDDWNRATLDEMLQQHGLITEWQQVLALQE